MTVYYVMSCVMCVLVRLKCIDISPQRLYIHFQLKLKHSRLQYNVVTTKYNIENIVGEHYQIQQNIRWEYNIDTRGCGYDVSMANFSCVGTWLMTSLPS